MRLTRLLSRWIKKSLQPTQPIRRSAMLKLDALETRDVPTNFSVTNLHDTVAAGSLRWAINQVNASTTATNSISINTTGLLNLTAALPKIAHEVTIINSSGGGFTINGGNAFQILLVGAPVTLDKINLTKGFANGGNGGAIDVTKAVAVALNSCNVTLSTATNNGGGLFSSRGQCGSEPFHVCQR